MRRLAIALAIPLLLVACASQPPRKLSGSYAVLLDPELDPDVTVRPTPLLHQLVRATLMHRLELAPSEAEAETVIVLKPSDRPGQIAYEIRRGGKVVEGLAGAGLIAPGNTHSISETQYEQRQHDRIARTEAYPRPEWHGPNQPTLTAMSRAGGRVAEQILRRLRTL